MGNSKLIDFDNNQNIVYIKTDLTKNQVMSVMTELCNNQDIKVIDLKAVSKVDTSALALLIECQKNNKFPIKIKNPPDELIQLANVVEVDFLLN